MTFPSIGAGTRLSIFIASMISRGSPALTTASIATSTLTTRPGIGGATSPGLDGLGRLGLAPVPVSGSFRHAGQHFLDGFERDFFELIVDPDVVGFASVDLPSGTRDLHMIGLAVDRHVEFDGGQMEFVAAAGPLAEASQAVPASGRPFSRASKKSRAMVGNSANDS